MKIANDKSEFYISKKELSIIASALVEFSQEQGWGLDVSEDQKGFRSDFILKFGFSLDELCCIEDALCDLRRNFRGIDLEKICIYLSDNAPQKPKVIYTALNECSKNYEEYEISTRTGIYKQELDQVLKEFKEKVIDAKVS